MRLLITRPEVDAAELKVALASQGHQVLAEPLLKVNFEGAEAIDIGSAQALIATSRNGVRALATCPAIDVARSLPLYAVGPGTAAAAKALSFTQVIIGPRAAKDLVTLIALHAEVNAGPLVYLAGDTLATDLAFELRRLGFHVLEPVVYTTEPAQEFSKPIIGRFKKREIDGVLLFSPQTARIYVRLVRLHDLIETTRTITHFCLSAAVARTLDVLPTPRTAVAQSPNLQQMLALVASYR